jgi:hypothetical protein
LGSSNQSAKHHRRGTCVVEGGVRRRHVETKLLHQPRQPGGLALREVQHEPGQRGGVDDRVLERALEPSPHQPGVERVMAVLDQNGTVGETQKCPARVMELGRADQHRTVDVVAPASVRIDWRTAVDEGVEEGKRA